MAAPLYHRTNDAAALSIESEGFRQSQYPMDDKWGVHFCGRSDRHVRPGDDVLFEVVLSVDALNDSWRQLCQADCVDYVVPEGIVNLGRRRRI